MPDTPERIAAVVVVSMVVAWMNDDDAAIVGIHDEVEAVIRQAFNRDSVRSGERLQAAQEALIKPLVDKTLEILEQHEEADDAP